MAPRVRTGGRRMRRRGPHASGAAWEAERRSRTDLALPGAGDSTPVRWVANPADLSYCEDVRRTVAQDHRAAVAVDLEEAGAIMDQVVPADTEGHDVPVMPAQHGKAFSTAG